MHANVSAGPRATSVGFSNIFLAWAVTFSFNSSQGMGTVWAGSAFRKIPPALAAFAQMAWTSQAAQMEPRKKECFMHAPQGEWGKGFLLFIECRTHRHERFFFS